MKRIQWYAFLITVLLAVSGSLIAQTSSTSLQGTVSDPSGSAIQGATVVLVNAGSGAERTAITGGQGEYNFLGLPPGNYTLTVTGKGFTRYEQKELQLLVNTPATANVRLKVGAATETVTVTGEAPALNLVDASIGNSFNQTQVRDIPLEGRNVPEMLSLQAGVAYTGNRPDNENERVKNQDTRNGAVNGARSDQSNITLDGVDVNDQSGGYAFTSVLPITQDSVQEFRVTTSNYNADQGTGSGAQVALVTRSGTNNFHGSLYEYHRNTITTANDYFVKGAEVGAGLPNKPDKLIRNIFGVSVGGPIRKDRLFFFSNYEGTRRREEESTVRAIPTSGPQGLCNGFISYPDVNGGTTTISPANLMALDPVNHTGINPAIENPQHTGYFDTTFCTGKFLTNDSSVGDGFNYSGFRFRAPVKENNNVFIAKLDYRLTTDGKHSLSWRGAMQNRNNPQAPFLPGAPPETTLVDHSKGFVVGYTGVLKPTMVNTFHWGFTRQSTGFIGNTKQEWNVFYGLDQGIAYSHSAQTPVHNFSDDLAWTKGTHTLQFGGNIGIVRNPRVSLEHSFSVGKGATNWMSPTGFANTGGGSPLDPLHIGKAEPASSFAYDYPVLGLLGMVSDIVGNYNYDKQGNPLPKGTPVHRKYGLEWYEIYGQDSWRVKPNLTLTYGVRWSLFPPPWEVNGFQAAPDVNLGTQFNQLVSNMKQGMGYDSIKLLSFVPGGPANHGPGWYNFEKSDFSPRISFAYSPRASSGWMKSIFGNSDKTVIRGGFSKVYDRAGMQMLSTFDANPPGGFGATIQNFCCTPGYDDAAHVPRISNINTIPVCGPVDNCADPANQKFFLDPPDPMHPPDGNQAISWGVDPSVKTPFAYALDFSVGRELSKGLSLELAYVGRLGRNLMTQRDLRQPLDIVDPKTGVDYYAAATALAKVAQTQLANGGINPGAVTDAMVGPTAAYWHNLLPPLQPGANNFTSYSGFSAAPGNAGLIQAVYDLFYDPGLNYLGNEVVGIGNLDLYGGLNDNLAGTSYHFCASPGCTGKGGNVGNYLNNQATSMFAWSSIGKSSYHGLQATIRKHFSNGAQFDFNYTYSRSIDSTSAATRLSWSSSVNVGSPGTRLANAFSPNSRRGVSDFDTTHQINANWMAALPFGKGKRFAGGAGGLMDAFIGGWELSGVTRWTSGFPLTVDNGNFWATNWDEQGIAKKIGPVQTGNHRDPVTGAVSVFANPAAAFKAFAHPFPGEGGSRNVIRGDGYAGLDMALSKRWKLPLEGQTVQFRWGVYNVPNLHRFNVGALTSACNCIASLQQLPQSFGNYTGLLTNPRVMEFALRYEF